MTTFLPSAGELEVGFHLWLLFPHRGGTRAIPAWPRLASQACELKGSVQSHCPPCSALTHAECGLLIREFTLSPDREDRQQSQPQTRYLQTLHTVSEPF